MTFELIRIRFHFRASQLIVFPGGKSGNVLRGAFGALLHQREDGADYVRIFAPTTAGGGPSGLGDPPRPFVFRAAHLDGAHLAPGANFHFDVHLFDVRESAAGVFIDAFTRIGQQGLGPARGQAVLHSVQKEKLELPLDGPPENAARVRVRFVTPTELKAEQKLVTRPEFAVLLARVRDRISTLRSLYGAGPLEIDFRAMGERAGSVRLTRCDLRWTGTERRSSRTGQTHPLGGFTGEVEYVGELGEFLPYLRAAHWTGVGRQTVWGKGEICCDVCG